jgi:hypothetical protein
VEDEKDEERHRYRCGDIAELGDSCLSDEGIHRIEGENGQGDEEQHQSPENNGDGKGLHEGVHPEPGDAESVEKPEQGTDGQGEKNGCPGAAEQPGKPLYRHQDGHAGGEGENGIYGQVKVSAHENEPLGEDEHAHDGRMIKNVHQVGPGCEGRYAESAHRKKRDEHHPDNIVQ